MDVYKPLLGATLDIECPHCGHCEPDEFEVTEPGKVTQTQCPDCARSFHFALLECEICGDEYIVSCTEHSVAMARLLAVCSPCLNKGVGHEDPSPEFPEHL